MTVSKPAGLHEQSLRRRTLLATGALLFGSAAFVGLVSFVLVAAVRAVLPSHDAADGGPADEAAEVAEAATVDGEPVPAARPVIRPKRTGAIVNKDSKEKTDEE
jgi:hypothetical protein